MAAPMTQRPVLPALAGRATLHRKALAAAASVVLAFSSAGCTLGADDDGDKDVDLTDTITPGSSDGGGSDDGGSAGDGGSDDGSDAGSGSGSDDGSSGTTDVGGDDATGTSGGDDDGGDDATTTEPVDDTGFADTGGPPGPPDCVGIPSSEVADCCMALDAWCAEEHGEDHEAYAVCYWGPEYDGSTGCSPWGPPVPPRAAVS